jgi:pre-rRNA-processing protein TSR4
MDWKVRHKKECKKIADDIVANDIVKTLDMIHFPEYEIVIESDDDTSNYIDSSEDEDEHYDEENGKKDGEIMKELNKGTSNLSAEEISKYLGNETILDNRYSKFKEIVKSSPDQVIRYQRSGDPLWISSKNIPGPKDIPDCEACGSSRIFEFQIMPQMLNRLNLDTLEQGNNGLSGESIDWGVVTIYTCSSSCNKSASYKREFLWKQEIDNDHKESMSKL